MTRLVPHPAVPAPTIAIEVEARRPAPDRLALRYVVIGAISGLAIPARGEPARADELWRHTCFEAFLKPGDGQGYFELNLSPSRQWAAYAFDRHRQGMRPAAATADAIDVSATAGRLELSATLRLPGASEAAWRLGLTAVIEDANSGLSYWALRHPKTKPDFHDSVGLTLDL